VEGDKECALFFVTHQQSNSITFFTVGHGDGDKFKRNVDTPFVVHFFFLRFEGILGSSTKKMTRRALRSISFEMLNPTILKFLQKRFSPTKIQTPYGAANIRPTQHHAEKFERYVVLLPTNREDLYRLAFAPFGHDQQNEIVY
jgi:hypothetical protein